MLTALLEPRGSSVCVVAMFPSRGGRPYQFAAVRDNSGGLLVGLPGFRAEAAVRGGIALGLHVDEWGEREQIVPARIPLRCVFLADVSPKESA